MAEPYKLPPTLDLSAATALATDLKDRLDGDLTLDASDVTQFGALGAQVVASAALSLSAAGHRLSLVQTSDRVLEQLSHLGFTPETLTEATV
ncbi:STAS domain-containing protein [Pseudooceanicola nitratireducens]|uniref:STAS domain-containing protein n=1 Tax=Pseudooceanicola nitratireducens TaxID=517719 RepID=UPI003515C187